MKVIILQNGPYQRLDGTPQGLKAIGLKKGDRREWPEWYAEYLIKAGLAREAKPKETIPEPTPVEINATKAALNLAEERGLNIAELEGSGAGGKITATDVRLATKVRQK